jgi:hypothetical protein
LIDLASVDLRDGDADFLLSFFNSDWSSDEPIHWCAGCCTATSFPARAKQAVHTAIAGLPDVPLLYRWKHFEAANSYALRGVGIHGLYLKALTVAKSKTTVVDEVPDETGELSIVAKQQRRLRVTMAFAKDSNSKTLLYQAMKFGRPLEHFMNSGLKLDKLMGILTFELQAAPAGVWSQELLDKVKAVQRNAHWHSLYGSFD